MIRFKKILVPVDFSPEAELALKWAVELATEQPGASVALINTPLPEFVGEGPYDVAPTMAPLREEARAKLETWRRRVPVDIPCSATVGLTDPADDIVAYAAQESVDAIVMTTKGRRGFARIVHPNLTEKVVRRASCPVIALHANDLAARLVGADYDHEGDRHA